MKSLLFSLVALLALPLAALATSHTVVTGGAYIHDGGYLPVPGHLVKLPTDYNPETTVDAAVYYIDDNQMRRAFPNRAVYNSWFEDFSTVREITAEEMAKIRLSGNITYRPGTRLVKIPSIPKVYAVEPGGALRWIESEDIAKSLYGPDWSKRVDDVPETVFLDYHETAPVTAGLWPTGTIVRRASDTALFVIDGLYKRHLRPGTYIANRILEAHIIDAGDELKNYKDGLAVLGEEPKLIDTAQMHRVETTPQPAVDFPAKLSAVTRGEEMSIYTFRMSTGIPAIIRELRINLSASGADVTRYVKDLRIVDGNGESLFGIKQLEIVEGGDGYVVFEGAYTLSENSSGILTLKATITNSIQVGETLTVQVPANGMVVADGGNGNLLDRIWPPTDWKAEVIVIQ